MPTLSSLLVQRGIASMKAIEEAIARQVLHGGDLATYLLELKAVPEQQLTALLAESLEIEPAPGKLRPENLDVLKTIPADLALRHGIFPLSRHPPDAQQHHEVLVIATAQLLSPEVEDDLSFALGLSLKQRAAPLVRIRQALKEYYGTPLERRFIRVINTLDADTPQAPPPVPAQPQQVKTPEAPPQPQPIVAAAKPPADAPVEATAAPLAEAAEPPVEAAAEPPAEAADAPVEAAVEPSAEAADAPVEAAATPAPEAAEAPVEAAATPAPEAADSPVEAAAEPLAEAAEAPVEAAVEPPAEAADAPVEAAAEPPAEAADAPVEAAVEPPAEAEEPQVETAQSPDVVTQDAVPADTQEEHTPQPDAVRGDLSNRPLAAWIKRSLEAGLSPHATSPGIGPIHVEPSAEPPDQTKEVDRPRRISSFPADVRPRRKGPFTAAMAESELGEVQSSDAVLEVLVNFSQQYFEYVALFVVQGDLAEGRAAVGPGADKDRISKIGVPLDLPSTLATARDRRAPLVTRFLNDGIDAEVQRDLGRVSNQAVALIPVAVRNRVVALLYGDDGNQSIQLAEIGDVIAMAGLAGAALERLILQKKFGRSASQVVQPRQQVKKPTFQRNKPVEAPPWQRTRAHQDQQPQKDQTASSDDDDEVSHPYLNEIPDLEVSKGPSHSEESPFFDKMADTVRAPTHPPARHDPPVAPVVVQAPPARSSSKSRRRPSGDYAAQLDKLLVGREDSVEVFAELALAGEAAMPTIATRFPGPLWVDRYSIREQFSAASPGDLTDAIPPASQCGPILELIVTIRKPAIPFMTVRSSASDPEVRFWAIHVLGELPYREAANAVLPRLFDDDVAVRRIARRSAVSLVNSHPAGGDPAGEPILQVLDHIARDHEELISRRLIAIETMAEIRSSTFVPSLIVALADWRELIVDAAASALVDITSQDFGRDARAWNTWWASQTGRHRTEWLIDALTHEQQPIRQAALNELQAIVELADEAEPLDLAHLQQQYRSWWAAEGQSRFGQSGSVE